MPKFHLISDIHLDIWNHRKTFDHFIADLDPGDCPTLIIAGDLGEYTYLVENAMGTFECLCDKYDEVIYVAGNHEYYGSNYERTQDRLRELDAQIENLFYLENETFFSQVGLVAGTTLWFKDGPFNQVYEGIMRDFDVIENHRKWVYKVNADALFFLEGLVESESMYPDVVITHHMPSRMSIHEKYKNANSNLYFLCDVTEIILDLQPQIWVHGHTHVPCDYMINDTRVVCNPRGYPKERSGVYESQVIEIERV